MYWYLVRYIGNFYGTRELTRSAGAAHMRDRIHISFLMRWRCTTSSAGCVDVSRAWQARLRSFGHQAHPSWQGTKPQSVFAGGNGTQAQTSGRLASAARALLAEARSEVTSRSSCSSQRP